MANLLSRKTRPLPFPRLDPAQFERFESRLRRMVEASQTPERLRALERRLSSFEEELEELDSDPSLATANDLLDQFDRARLAAVAPFPEAEDPRAMGGELICYYPGRSLSTGEAELASRGFFDLIDRPPLAYWVEAIARPSGSTRDAFEVAILIWVPGPELDRAEAGLQACRNGSLESLREASKNLYDQVRPTLDAVDVSR